MSLELNIILICILNNKRYSHNILDSLNSNTKQHTSNPKLFTKHKPEQQTTHHNVNSTLLTIFRYPLLSRYTLSGVMSRCSTLWPCRKRAASTRQAAMKRACSSRPSRRFWRLESTSAMVVLRVGVRRRREWADRCTWQGLW